MKDSLGVSTDQKYQIQLKDSLGVFTDQKFHRIQLKDSWEILQTNSLGVLTNTIERFFGSFYRLKVLTNTIERFLGVSTDQNNYVFFFAFIN